MPDIFLIYSLLTTILVQFFAFINLVDIDLGLTYIHQASLLKYCSISLQITFGENLRLLIA